MSSTDEKNLGNVLVLGLGGTGAAVCRYLAGLVGTRVESVTLYGGASSKEGDLSRELEALGVTCVLGTEDVKGSYDLAVTSPGIPKSSEFFKRALACSAEVIGEPELAFRESPEHWLAITGTNGKTTTTSLTTHLLGQAGMDAISVGNIGRTIVGELSDRRSEEWFVAELSSFQLACASELRPRAAVLLNITPDHLEWHGSMQDYAESKARIFHAMGADCLAVVSVDDEYCAKVACELAEGADAPAVCHLSVCSEPAGDAAFVRGGRLVVRLADVEHDLLAADELNIRGQHNWENALAASALALFVGVGEDDVRRGLASFNPIEHRIEPCGSHAGVNFVNDSKATNTDSVEKALTAFDAGTICLLLGGHDKMTDLTSLAAAVCDRVRLAVCYGEAGERIACALEAARAENSSGLEVVRAPHMREAFDAAVAAARPGDTVLLSPACSSFDEFNNMGERGRLFKKLVSELGE